MTRNAKFLKKAVSLYSAVKHLKEHDCANFIHHLNDEGIEVLCRVIHHVLNGELVLNNRTRGRLRKKIKSDLATFVTLSKYPRKALDIRRKRKLLQRGGIIGILTAIARTVLPVIAQLLTRK